MYGYSSHPQGFSSHWSRTLDRTWFLCSGTRSLLIQKTMSWGAICYIVGCLEVSWPLPTKPQQHLYSFDNQKSLQMLPDVQLGGKSPPVENCWCRNEPGQQNISKLQRDSNLQSRLSTRVCCFFNLNVCMSHVENLVKMQILIPSVCAGPKILHS